MWNQTNINSLTRQHQQLEQFYKHQVNIQSIKNNKGCIYTDDNQPIRPKFFDGEVKSKKVIFINQLFIYHFQQKILREIEIETENRSLFNKMQAVTKKPGDLNPGLLKKQGYQKGSLNLDSRVNRMRKIVSQNEFMDNRLQNVKSKVDVKSIENNYRLNDSYQQNISKHSRRIVNCFLDQDKRRKYHSQSLLTKNISTQQQIKNSSNEKRQSNEQLDYVDDNDNVFLTGQQDMLEDTMKKLKQSEKELIEQQEKEEKEENEEKKEQEEKEIEAKQA